MFNHSTNVHTKRFALFQENSAYFNGINLAYILKVQNSTIWTNMVQLIRATGYKAVYRTIVLNQSHLCLGQNDYKEANKKTKYRRNMQNCRS